MNDNKTPENRLKSPFYKIVTGNLAIQIMLTIIALIIYAFAGYYWQELGARIITSVITIPIYILLLYTFNWGIAERERNMVLYGHMEEDKKRGLRAGLYAAIPFFLYSLIIVVLIYTTNNTDFSNITGIYKMVSSPFILVVIPFIDKAPFALPFLAAVSPFVCWLGYYNGSKLYSIWDHIIYKNGVNENRKKRG